MSQKRSIFILAVVACLCLTMGVFFESVNAASVGQTLINVQVRDSNDNPSWIYGFGKKLITVFYTDPDVKDVVDPLADAIKAKNYSRAKYRGVGIVNMKDTWLPNAAIRMAVRSKEKKYDTQILTDPDRLLKTKWGLGNCNGYSVIIIVGKDKKVKFIKKVSSQSQSRAIISQVIQIIEQEI